MLNPGSPVRPNPATTKPTTHVPQRMAALLDGFSTRNDRLLIPTPALAEVLCVAAGASQILSVLNDAAVIEIAPFDARSAIELGEMTRKAIASGDKKEGVNAEWQRIKLDRQIVAIAKAHGARVLYTDDDNQMKFAKIGGLATVSTWELDLPPKYAQMDILNDDDKKT